MCLNLAHRLVLRALSEGDKDTVRFLAVLALADMLRSTEFSVWFLKELKNTLGKDARPNPAASQSRVYGRQARTLCAEAELQEATGTTGACQRILAERRTAAGSPGL